MGFEIIFFNIINEDLKITGFQNKKKNYIVLFGSVSLFTRRYFLTL